jgi:hypothetical protein
MSGVNDMERLARILLLSFIFASVMSILIVSVEAQDDAIRADIYPSEGTASTMILVRFVTTNASVGNVEQADFFWDDSSITLNEQGIQGADGSYNYWLNVPTEPPLSDLANHTIRADSFVSGYGPVSFNFTFRIIEYVPSPEYVALNASYHALLLNYSDLLGNYSSLSANYSSLLADHNGLLNEHNTLLQNINSLSANYNSLIADYNALSANYNSMLTNYNNLYSSYSLFLTNYSRMQGNYDALNSYFNTLRTDFDSLESNYDGMKANYNDLLGGWQWRETSPTFS